MEDIEKREKREKSFLFSVEELREGGTVFLRFSLRWGDGPIFLYRVSFSFLFLLLAMAEREDVAEREDERGEESRKRGPAARVFV